jgi:hypothetical protein
MRYLLPAVATAAALALGATPIAAAKPHHQQQPKRVESHVSLHLSSHAALGGRAVVIRAGCGRR